MDLIRGVARELSGNLTRELCHLRVRPFCALAFLTYRCTNRCRTCNIWEMGGSPAGELDREGWLSAVSRLAGLGVRSLEIFGGDALLRKDAIFDVIAACRRLGISSYFPTNGNLTDHDTLARLIEAGLDMIYFSIDDLDEAQDRVRGVEGNFASIRGALDSFVALRGERTLPGLGIVCTLSRLNFRNFPRLVEFLEQFPVSAIYPRPLAEFSAGNVAASALDGVLPEPFFMPADGESHLMTPEELPEFKAMVRRMQSRRNRVYVCWSTYYATSEATFLKGEYPPAVCRVATTLTTISPNGDVSPCPFYRGYVLGNLLHDGAGEIWGSARHRRFIAAQKAGELPLCLNCNVSAYHNSSLAATAKYYLLRAAEKSGVYHRF
ncbi:hypothetical protein GMSM_08800 [Geomonas sp. Red276]